MEGTNFVDTGNFMVITDCKLKPIGNYGSNLLTMPPEPNSPAINAASGTTSLGTDQRNLTRTVGTFTDIGACEYQGILDDMINTFEIDSDQDGYANGLEIAIGTDPLVKDYTNNRRLKINVPTSLNPVITFGHSNTNIPLKLTKSTDLINFSTVLYANGQCQNTQSSILEIIDVSSLIQNKAFYRLEATRP